MPDNHGYNSNLTIKQINKIEQFDLDFSVNPAEVFDFFSNYKGERYIFINKDKSFKLIGIGHQVVIAFDEIQPVNVEAQFKALMSEACFHGTGAIEDLKLFGGFQFDDNESANFSNFHKSHFVIPKFQFMEVDGHASLLCVDQDIDVPALIDEIKNHKLSHTTDNTVVKSEDIDLELFKANAYKAIEMMKEEKLEKVVLSRKRKVTMEHSINTLTFVQQAMTNHEVSYFALMEAGKQTFVSKTPEQLVAVQDGILHTNAIAGTMSKDIPEATSVLLGDDKNLHEHKIVVESIQEDLAPFTQEIYLKDKPDILENQFFYHLYTPIRAKLNRGGLLEVTKSLHPTPALGGFPKHTAMDFLMQANEGRGLYGAPLGYLNIQDAGEFIVAIRSMIVEDHSAILYAGCGIVKSSEVESEVYETEIKFKPMLEMLGVNKDE
ncbi:isochorismate synthase [Macrococcus equi]|uniref:isochorismate synthase n=1 Tax=Macrococcus equi TaxID=3395462 RepID=UPI0039BDCB45